MNNCTETPQQKWARLNPEKDRECKRRSRKKHPEAGREARKRWREAHPEEHAKRNREWNAANPDKMRANTLRRHGITPDVYTEMLESQNGVCAICGEEQKRKLRGKVLPLHIDHDHATGKVRGLLCHHCNAGLGHFFDKPEVLSRAIAYLQETA